MNKYIDVATHDVQDIILSDGDVRRIRVLHNQGDTRLLIFDDEGPVPLVHAYLSAGERRELLRALTDRTSV